MKKPLSYILVIAIIGLLGYKSIYFKKLSEVKNTSNARFDPVGFTKKLWDEKMSAKIDSAVDLTAFIHAVKSNREAAFSQYSNALGIGNYRYTLIKTQGTVSAVQEDDVTIQLPVSDSIITAVLATEYIYGNAIRDASKLVAIDDFSNSADLNSISEQMNKTVRSSVLPEFKKAVKQGDKVAITAAIEMNAAHIKWSGLELLPVRLQIVK